MADVDLESKVDEILRKLPPEDSTLIIRATINKVLDQLKDVLIQPVGESLGQSLGNSDAVLLAADELAKSTGETSEDVLLKALTLYEAAIEAKEKGQRLILAGPDYRFIREIVGFDPASPQPVGSENVAR
jgi:hypothetical protein